MAKKKTNLRLTKTNTNKKRVINALEKTLGVVTSACKNVDISRVTFYEWYNTDEEFKKQVDSVGDIALDFAESQLHQQIKEGIPSSTIFYLKTKGKKRGYFEKIEQAHDVTEEFAKTILNVFPQKKDLKE